MNILLIHIIGQTAFCPLSHLFTGILAMRAPAAFPEPLSAALFETHWIWWIGAIVLGALMLFLGRSRATSRLARAGTVVLLITLVWLLAARFIDTSAERLHAAHEGLAAAAEKGDIDKIFSYIAKDFTAPAINIHLDSTTEAERKEISDRLKEYGIKESTITAYNNAQQGSNSVTIVTFLTKYNMGSIPTTWRLSWKDVPGDDWKIFDASLTQIAGQAIRQGEVIP